MNKKYSWLLIIVAIIALSGAANALDSEKEEGTLYEFTVKTPGISVEKSKALGIKPGTFEKTTFIHHAKNSNNAKQAKTATCYKLLKIKWGVLPQKYFIHPAVEATVPGAIATSVNVWDSATSKGLFGNYTVDPTANWDETAPDGRNEYSFGNYSQIGVIAVTSIWSGIPIGQRTRQIIEYDVMFDTDYRWGDAMATTSATTTPVMDLENIAIHETGHGLGLDDIYTSNCSEVTMYGYSNYGEIKKRTLEAPDITGLRRIYGL